MLLLVYANTYVVNLDEQIFESHLTTNCEHDSTITKFTYGATPYAYTCYFGKCLYNCVDRKITVNRSCLQETNITRKIIITTKLSHPETHSVFCTS
jgi:hypothetical protein